MQNVSNVFKDMQKKNIETQVKFWQMIQRRRSGKFFFIKQFRYLMNSVDCISWGLGLDWICQTFVAEGEG
jgi:hypothetical protein